MAVDYKKLADMINNNYKKDLTNKYYEEFEKNFNSYILPKFKEAMSNAIDKFYSFPQGKVYKRTDQFKGGKKLFDIYISKGGRVITGSAGNGFPSYPAMKVKGKWSRTKPWPGDEAWGVLFEAGMHGTGRMHIGTTEPTPYEIVEKEMNNSIDEYVQFLSNERMKQLQDEILNGYLMECM